MRLLPSSLDLGCQIYELSEKSGCSDSEGTLSLEMMEGPDPIGSLS